MTERDADLPMTGESASLFLMQITFLLRLFGDFYYPTGSFSVKNGYVLCAQ